MRSRSLGTAAFFVIAGLQSAAAAAAGEPFVDDAKAGAQFRSLYFERNLPTSNPESWAAGGWVWGRTGYWRDTLQLGGTVYGSLKLLGDADNDGGRLLKPGQKSFGVLGEAYARLKLRRADADAVPADHRPQSAEGRGACAASRPT